MIASDILPLYMLFVCCCVIVIFDISVVPSILYLSTILHVCLLYICYQDNNSINVGHFGPDPVQCLINLRHFSFEFDDI